MNILFIVPYPLKEAPSQRFRFEQYFRHLVDNGHTYEVNTFLDSHNWQIFFKRGKPIQKFVILAIGFFRRLWILFRLSRFDRIFLHREAAPLGPPVVEWIIARLLRKKMIYDFDDAIWLTDRPHETSFMRMLKNRSKVKKICRWSYRISCGNEFLAEFARHYNDDVVINPTTIDTDGQHNPHLFPPQPHHGVVIGWTGSHTTIKFLEQLEPVLQKVQAMHPEVSFAVIADRAPALRLERLRFLPWSAATEVSDLSGFDVGIMPLPDNDWAKGKCGFKALQYMAMAIPPVISPVGVNTDIVDEGVDGRLANTTDEWLTALGDLISSAEERRRLGKNARSKVEQRYSVKANVSNFLALFERL